jgi:hypothetical protein
MTQFLLQNQGLLENLALLTLLAAIAWTYLYVWPRFKEGWSEDPMYGTFFAKDHRHRPN